MSTNGTWIPQGLGSTSYNNRISNSVTPSKVLIYSESILGAGNFPALLQAALNPDGTYLQSIYGGSHIDAALVEEADEVWIPMCGENMAINSNKWDQLSTPGWQALDSGVTVASETLSDGTVWNKITKTSSVATSTPKQQITYPSNPTGIFVSFEVYCPDGSLTSLIVSCYDQTVASEKTATFTIEKGIKYKFIVAYPKAAIPTWVATNLVKVQIKLNGATGNGPCVTYMKDMEISCVSPGLFENYVPTLGTAVAAGAATWTKAFKHPYNYIGVDAAAISYARNEAGEDPRAFYRAYDKMISQVLKRTSNVTIGCPPPQYDTTNKVFLNSDSYANINPYFNALAVKWNVESVNVYELFKWLVESGKYRAEQLMGDPFHQTQAGSYEMAMEYASSLKSKRIPNFTSPELSNPIKYYLQGMPTGTWAIQTTVNCPEARLIGSGQAIVSSTLNDTLLFSNVTAERLGVLYREGTGFGTFQLIIDEGTAIERAYSIDTSAAVSERFHGNFITDFLAPGTHTIKIKVTSTGKSVKIHGISAI